jgi:hypothetical protein
MAIAQLFGGYVRPGFTSKQMRSALTNSQWLDACWLEPQGALGGPADLDYSTGRPFLLRLFPDEAKNTRWFIYFTLTGGIPEWQISLNDASAFLRGSHTNKNIRIAEFCLFYPAVLPGFHPDRRVTERFTRKGVGLKVN